MSKGDYILWYGRRSRGWDFTGVKFEAPSKKPWQYWRDGELISFHATKPEAEEANAKDGGKPNGEH